MAKKTYPDFNELPELGEDFGAPEPSGFKHKLSQAGNKAFGLIKLVLGICLLPCVYTFTTAFFKQIGLIEKSLQGYFWAGVDTLLIVYLFVWEPARIYKWGHKLLEIIFNFIKPLVKVAPYLLPIYTIVLFIVYGLLSLMIKSSWLIEYTIFLAGFSIALHLVFSAKSIRGKKGDFLKANYIFGFSFIYIINVMILAFCLNLTFSEFSFVNFSNNAFQSAGDIFYAVFKQLFLR